MKKVLSYLLILSMLTMVLTSCGSVKVISSPDEFDMSAYDTTKPIKFELIMESGDRMEGELYYKDAPITVANFITLANSGFYNGLTFHRAVKGKLIQGGCQYGDGTSGKNNTDYTIRGEFTDNGWKSVLANQRGVIAMARYSDNMNSAYSQFFINLDTNRAFDGIYATFGKITSGILGADKIAASGDESETPTTQQVIKELNILGN